MNPSILSSRRASAIPRRRPTSCRYSGPVRYESRCGLPARTEHRLIADDVRQRVATVEQHASDCRMKQSGQHFDRGALAGPVRAEEAQDLPGPDLERQIVHRRQRAVALRQPAHLDHGRLDTVSATKGLPR